MNVNTGLFPTATPNNITENTMSFALNVQPTEDGQTLINEKGFDLDDDYTNPIDYGTCIGVIAIPTGSILFFKGSFDAIIINTVVDEKKIRYIFKSSLLNFSVDRPITGDYSYNYKNQLLISWSEGISDEANETRLLNVAEFSKKIGGVTDIIKDVTTTNIYIDSSRDIEFLNLIPSINYPTITNTVIRGGNLLVGSYQIAVAYKLGIGSYSDYCPLGVPINIVGNYETDVKTGDAINKSIIVNFTNLDTYYTEYKVGLIYHKEGSTKAYEILDNKYERSEAKLTIGNLSTLTEASLEDIMLGSIAYVKDDTHCNFNSQLIRANVKSVNYEGIDAYVTNLLGTNNVTGKNPITITKTVKSDIGGSPILNRTKDLGNNRYFKTSECYFFYVTLLDYKGKIINAYPIPDTTKKNWYTQMPDDNTSSDGVQWCECKANTNRFVQDIKQGKYKNIIKSYSIYIAEANMSNSNWICQSLCVRDSGKHSLDPGKNGRKHTFENPFRSTNALRIYPIEYMIQKRSFPSSVIYSQRRTSVLYYNTSGDQNTKNLDDNMFDEDNDDGLHGFGSRHALSLNPLRTKYNSFLKEGKIVKLEYVPNDNAAVSNVAGESYYRLSDTSDLISKLTGLCAVKQVGNSKAVQLTNNLIIPPNDNEYYGGGYIRNSIYGKWGSKNGLDYRNTKDNKNWLKNDDDASLSLNLFSRSICEFYTDMKDSIDVRTKLNGVNLYEQKLVTSTSIYNLDLINPIDLVGDCFISNITLRSVTPCWDYTVNDSLKNTIYNSHVLITSAPIISRFNLQGRYSGTGNNNKVFNVFTDPLAVISKSITKDDDLATRQNLYDQVITADNFINTSTGICYDTSLNWLGENDIVYRKDDDSVVYQFPARIIRSEVNASESLDIGWRRFKPTSYYDVPIQRGVIIKLLCDDMNLYIQQEHTLRIAGIKDTLGNSEDDNATYVGSADLFDRQPREAIYENTGMVGCRSKFSCIVNTNGYCVIDEVKHKIFIVKGQSQVDDLADIGMRQFMDTFLYSDGINPLMGHGAFLTYDDFNKRLLLTLNGHSKYRFTLSYSFVSGRWICFHSYIPHYSFTNRFGMFYLNGNKVYKTESTTNKGIYLNEDINPSIVQYIWNQKPELSKNLKFIEWTTLVSDSTTTPEKRSYLYNKSFDFCMVNTDDQCTGLRRVQLPDEWYNTSEARMKAGRWMFNELDNYIPDKSAWLIKPQYLPFNDIKGTYEGLMNAFNNDWFEINKILTKFAYITLYYNNSFYNHGSNDEIPLFEPLVIQQQLGRQCEIEFTDFKVINDKDTRL